MLSAGGGRLPAAGVYNSIQTEKVGRPHASAGRRPV